MVVESANHHPAREVAVVQALPRCFGGLWRRKEHEDAHCGRALNDHLSDRVDPIRTKEEEGKEGEETRDFLSDR